MAKCASCNNQAYLGSPVCRRCEGEADSAKYRRDQIHDALIAFAEAVQREPGASLESATDALVDLLAND